MHNKKLNGPTRKRNANWNGEVLAVESERLLHIIYVRNDICSFVKFKWNSHCNIIIIVIIVIRFRSCARAPLKHVQQYAKECWNVSFTHFMKHSFSIRDPNGCRVQQCWRLPEMNRLMFMVYSHYVFFFLALSTLSRLLTCFVCLLACLLIYLDTLNQNNKTKQNRRKKSVVISVNYNLQSFLRFDVSVCKVIYVQYTLKKMYGAVEWW